MLLTYKTSLFAKRDIDCWPCMWGLFDPKIKFSDKKADNRIWYVSSREKRIQGWRKTSSTIFVVCCNREFYKQFKHENWNLYHKSRFAATLFQYGCSVVSTCMYDHNAHQKCRKRWRSSARGRTPSCASTAATSTESTSTPSSCIAKLRATAVTSETGTTTRASFSTRSITHRTHQRDRTLRWVKAHAVLVRQSDVLLHFVYSVFLTPITYF